MTQDKLTHSQTANFIWSVADLLRGDFKQSQYGRIILPFTLLRRLECVLEPSRESVHTDAQRYQSMPETAYDMLLKKAAGHSFYNTSSMKLGTLSATQTADDLVRYVQSFSKDAREIFENFKFEEFVQQLNSSNLLFQVVQRFASIDLSINQISNYGMGIVFEELIRKFAESSNETAGEHFTPRDIVHLTTSLVFTGQEHRLKPGSIVTVYDPTVGTGGFLSEGDEYIQRISQGVSVSLHGQELNPESYAICKAEMMIKGQDVQNIKQGDTLAQDLLADMDFDIMLSNPPFGVDWKKVQSIVELEHQRKGFEGRFGPGLPRVSDGSLLFLLHLVSKMRMQEDGGSRIGIILNGSPLFTGGAGSGESEIRRYLLEHDLVEAIIALPTDMFYNTGIATYIWILSNNKPAVRKGKVQLVDATNLHSKMRKSMGSKRQYISEADQDQVVRLYGGLVQNEQSKLFPTHAFGYRRITVERPLRLSAQMTDERIAQLRFGPGALQEPMQALYQRFGNNWDADSYGQFEDLDEAKALLKADFPALRASHQAAVLDAVTWKAQKALLATAKQLQGELGTEQSDDFNAFDKQLAKALKAIGAKLSAADKKQIVEAVTWVNPEAEPVIKKTYQDNPRPLYGLFEYRGKVVEFQADTNLRDNENIPLNPDVATRDLIESYFIREVQPHVADAWIDESKTDALDHQVGVVGYEIPFNRHFYVFQPPRSLEEIDRDLKACTDRIKQMIEGLSA